MVIPMIKGLGLFTFAVAGYLNLFTCPLTLVDLAHGGRHFVFAVYTTVVYLCLSVPPFIFEALSSRLLQYNTIQYKFYLYSRRYKQYNISYE